MTDQINRTQGTGVGATMRGKVAIVTGAGSGLGQATALALSRRGARIAMIDVSAGRLEQTAKHLGTSPAGAPLPVSLDVSNAEQVAAAVDRVVSELGRVDYLVNAAGIDYTLSIEELTVEQYDRILGVNLRGPFLLMKAVFPHMRQTGGGHIVNIASTAAIRTWANASAYTASKFGLVGLTRAIGVEGRPHNIKATTVFPGGMATNFFDRPDLEIKPDLTDLNDPANVAEVIAYVLEQPARSVVQEVLVTPLTETSWP